MEKLNLSRLKKCDQNWDEMKAAKQGRLCEQCSKVIHDFRGKSNSEINQTHIESEEVVCGIYSSTQFNPIGATIQSKHRNRSVVALGVSSLIALSSSPADAQEISKPKIERLQTEKTDPSELQNISSEVHEDSVKATIQGMVFEETNGKRNSLPFTNVIVEGSTFGAQTDFDGKFSIDISNLDSDKDSVTIIVQMIGYEKVRKTIPLEGDAIIRMDTQLTGEVIGFYVTVQPWYVRLWNRIKAFFYRITHW